MKIQILKYLEIEAKSLRKKSDQRGRQMHCGHDFNDAMIVLMSFLNAHFGDLQCHPQKRVANLLGPPSTHHCVPPVEGSGEKVVSEMWSLKKKKKQGKMTSRTVPCPRAASQTSGRCANPVSFSTAEGALTRVKCCTTQILTEAFFSSETEFLSRGICTSAHFCISEDISLQS